MKRRQTHDPSDSYGGASPRTDQTGDPVRHPPVSDGNGGYLEDKITLGIRNDGGRIADIITLGLGESVKITLVVTPADLTVDVYANGEYIGTDASGKVFDQSQIRFGDSTASCDITISGIVLSWAE